MGEVDRRRRVKLVVDEWGAWHKGGTEVGPAHLFGQQSTLRDALLARLTLDTFQRDAKQRYGDLAAEFLSLYPAATDEEAKRAQNDSARDRARATLYFWAQERAKTARTSVFTYFWTHVLPGPDAAQYGAFHTSEVPYVLNTLAMSERPFTPKDHQIAATLSSYWVNFATSGDPNGKGLPPWPAVGADQAQTMEVGAEFRPIPIAGSPARIDFFRRVLSGR